MNESVDHIFQIHDYIEQSIFSTTSGIIAMVLLGAAGVCTIIVVLWFAKQALTKPKTPGQKAERALSKLSVPADDASLEAMEQFYCRLTNIAKNFLGERFSLNLNGKTDVEVVALLKSNKQFKAKKYRNLSDVFMGGQTIKFAAQGARFEQMNRDKNYVVSSSQDDIKVS